MSNLETNLATKINSTVLSSSKTVPKNDLSNIMN